MKVGHSFLSADRDFVRLEQAKKTTITYSPDDLANMISEAGVKHPFTVCFSRISKHSKVSQSVKQT